MPEETKSFSIAGSQKLSWELIDKRIQDLGLNNRSQYFQMLAEDDIFFKPKKLQRSYVLLASLLTVDTIGIILMILKVV